MRVIELSALLTNFTVESAPAIGTRAASTSQAASVILAGYQLAGLGVFAAISLGVVRANAVGLQLLVQPTMAARFARVATTGGAIAVTDIARFFIKK